jgi:hypothetical protein
MTEEIERLRAESARKIFGGGEWDIRLGEDGIWSVYLNGKKLFEGEKK